MPLDIFIAKEKGIIRPFARSKFGLIDILDKIVDMLTGKDELKALLYMWIVLPPRYLYSNR